MTLQDFMAKLTSSSNTATATPYQQASTQTITTTGTGTSAGAYNSWQLQNQQNTLNPNISSSYFPGTIQAGYYNPVPPTLPIKLNIREMCKLMQALDADEELRGIIRKFQPFIGVEV